MTPTGADLGEIVRQLRRDAEAWRTTPTITSERTAALEDKAADALEAERKARLTAEAEVAAHSATLELVYEERDELFRNNGEVALILGKTRSDLETAKGLLRRACEVERTDQVSDKDYDRERDAIGKRIDAFLNGNPPQKAEQT